MKDPNIPDEQKMATLDKVKNKFATKRDEIDLFVKKITPVSKQEGFQIGTGGMISKFKSLLSPKMAEMDSQTKLVFSKIKSEADLEELIMNQKAYKDAGVDVKALLEGFGVK